jgi:hypothetical protein
VFDLVSDAKEHQLKTVFECTSKLCDVVIGCDNILSIGDYVSFEYQFWRIG